MKRELFIFFTLILLISFKSFCASLPDGCYLKMAREVVKSKDLRMVKSIKRIGDNLLEGVGLKPKYFTGLLIKTKEGKKAMIFGPPWMNHEELLVILAKDHGVKGKMIWSGEIEAKNGKFTHLNEKAGISQNYTLKYWVEKGAGVEEIAVLEKELQGSEEVFDLNYKLTRYTDAPKKSLSPELEVFSRIRHKTRNHLAGLLPFRQLIERKMAVDGVTESFKEAAKLYPDLFKNYKRLCNNIVDSIKLIKRDTSVWVNPFDPKFDTLDQLEKMQELFASGAEGGYITDFHIEYALEYIKHIEKKKNSYQILLFDEGTL